MWMKLLAWVLPLLAQQIVAFIVNLQRSRMDDPDILAVVAKIVRGLAVDHPEWPGDKKYIYAFDAIKVYLNSIGRDVRESLVNTLIELEVQKLKTP